MACSDLADPFWRGQQMQAAGPCGLFPEPSLKSTFYEIPLHTAAIQETLGLLQAFSEREVIDIAKSRKS